MTMRTKPIIIPLVIGIHGPRGAGKDTLFARLSELEPRCVRMAFADRLKQDVAPLVREHMRYDPEALTPAQKEAVRPLWIGWGMACRAMDPLHWVKVVVGDIDHRWTWDEEPFIPVVTDVRFENEAGHLRDHFGSAFRLINLVREGAPPPTDEEEKHYRQVAAMADIDLHWGNDTLEGQMEHARRLLDQLGVARTVDALVGRGPMVNTRAA